MSRDHAAFEALAGAVALGEASAAESSAFALHAAGCTFCAADLRGDSPFERLRQARDAETWRPQLEGALLARVREARSKTVRRTFSVLGYAAGLSIVLNIAVATGFTDRLYERFEDANQPLPVSVAAPPVARAPARRTPVLAAAPRYIQRPLTAPLPSKAARSHGHPAGGRLGEVPDALAGLVQPAAVTASRDVAVEALSLDAQPADRAR